MTPILDIENSGIRLYFNIRATQPWTVEVDDPEAPTTATFVYDTLPAAIDRMVLALTDIDLVYAPEELPDDLRRAYLLVSPNYRAGYSQRRTAHTFLKYTLESLANVAIREHQF